MQFGDTTLSGIQVREWASKIKGGRESVDNASHDRHPRSSLTDGNIPTIYDRI